MTLMWYDRLKPNNAMAPARKKRKTNNSIERFLCFSCVTERLSTQFPDYLPSPDCDHLINTCKTCLKKWIEAKVEGGTFVSDGEGFGIKCPQCDSTMRNEDVEIAATKKVHAKFDRLERKHIANMNPGWRWCLNPACRAGKVHESQIPKSLSINQQGGNMVESSNVEKPDICICDECGAQACVICDRPWHTGETCVEYQARIKDRIDEEDKTLRQIQIKTKGCPNPDCKKRIEKNGGCQMVHCVACQSIFCWDCEELVVAGVCRCSRRLAQRGEGVQRTGR